jgi:hypothetical protein
LESNLSPCPASPLQKFRDVQDKKRILENRIASKLNIERRNAVILKFKIDRLISSDAYSELLFPAFFGSSGNRKLFQASIILNIDRRDVILLGMGQGNGIATDDLCLIMGYHYFLEGKMSADLSFTECCYFLELRDNRR